jgi:hypothetical protein
VLLDKHPVEAFDAKEIRLKKKIVIRDDNNFIKKYNLESQPLAKKYAQTNLLRKEDPKNEIL